MKVQFGNLQKDERETIVEGRSVEDRIKSNILDVVERKNFILGDYVQRFEKEFAEYCGVKHCIGVANGLSALELSLFAIGIKPGDEVITAANTFNATVGGILKTGAKPILVDVSDKNFNINIPEINPKITEKTRAIIPVHLYGQATNMSALLGIAKHRGIPVIEDACQAHGALYYESRAGSMGITGCFSFYPGKNLGCYGDGGAVTTNNDEIAEFIKKARNYGQTKKYFHDVRPDNSRLDTLQAAVLVEKLKVLDQWNSMRRKNAEFYCQELCNVKEVELPVESTGNRHVYHLFVIKALKRNELMKHLGEKGIDTGLHYPVPIHLQKCFSELGYKLGDFPVSEGLSEKILTLPMFPTLKAEDIKYVTDSIKEFYTS